MSARLEVLISEMYRCTAIGVPSKKNARNLSKEKAESYMKEIVELSLRVIESTIIGDAKDISEKLDDLFIGGKAVWYVAQMLIKENAAGLHSNVTAAISKINKEDVQKLLEETPAAKETFGSGMLELIHKLGSEWLCGCLQFFEDVRYQFPS